MAKKKPVKRDEFLDRLTDNATAAEFLKDGDRNGTFVPQLACNRWP